MKRLNEKNSILCYRAYLSEINSGFSNWYVEWLSVVYASPLSLASLLRLVRGFVSRTLPALPHRFLSSSNLSPPFEYLRLSSPSRIIRLFPRPWLSLVRSLASSRGFARLFTYRAHLHAVGRIPLTRRRDTHACMCVHAGICATQRAAGLINVLIANDGFSSKLMWHTAQNRVSLMTLYC